MRLYGSCMQGPIAEPLGDDCAQTSFQQLVMLSASARAGAEEERVGAALACGVSPQGVRAVSYLSMDDPQPCWTAGAVRCLPTGARHTRRRTHAILLC